MIMWRDIVLLGEISLVDKNMSDVIDNSGHETHITQGTEQHEGTNVEPSIEPEKTKGTQENLFILIHIMVLGQKEMSVWTLSLKGSQSMDTYTLSQGT